MPGGWSDDDGPVDPNSLHETQNVLRQSERVVELVEQTLAARLADARAALLTIAIICELNQLAMAGLAGR
ncbi:MAG: hypothetical protein IT381_22235 [Deltaproteobacteria bacterium]|nr:hypothetical protein [Deltaproteobacteria bacterium]